jgi:hypothetical protein
VKIVTVVFDYKDRQGMFGRLHHVFARSCARYMPQNKIHTHLISPPSKGGHSKLSFVSNTEKLTYWHESVKSSKQELMLADCDMMCRGGVSEVFDYDFDIGYTTREPGFKIPVNGGVMFVRPNGRTREFFRVFTEINRRMYTDRALHNQYYGKYQGMNQSAFGYMLENHSDLAELRPFPCRIYNSCDETWHTAMREAKLIHIKSRLRRLCVGSGNDYQQWAELKLIVRQWRRWESG